jgi:hypothetical protein
MVQHRDLPTKLVRQIDMQADLNMLVQMIAEVSNQYEANE